jgi:hypothetical protein
VRIAIDSGGEANSTNLALNTGFQLRPEDLCGLRKDIIAAVGDSTGVFEGGKVPLVLVLEVITGN